MKTRERKLLIGLVVVAVAGGAYALGPRVLKVLDYSESIEAARETLAEYEEKAEQYETEREKYAQYVHRTGGTNADAVKSELHRSINALIIGSELQQRNVTPKTKTDRRTGVETITFSIKADGLWANAMQFLEEFYKLPHVTQFTTLKLTPIAGRRGEPDRVTVDGDIDVIVLPDVEIVGRLRLPDAPIEEQPRTFVSADAAALAENPFVEPVVEAPPPEPPVVIKAPTEPSEPVEMLDPERDSKRICQIWNDSEVQVVQPDGGGSEWISEGDTLDGGQIVLVHPLGVVVSRLSGDYVYPLGRTLANSVELANATAYPEIQMAMDRLRAEAEREAAGDELASGVLPDDFVGPPYAETDGIAAPGASTDGFGMPIVPNGHADDADTNGARPPEPATPDAEDANTNSLGETEIVVPRNPTRVRPAPPKSRQRIPGGTRRSVSPRRRGDQR